MDGRGSPPAAFVQGRVDVDAGVEEVLVAVDGTIVTGSEVYAPDDGNRFLAWLPSSVVGVPIDLDIIVITTDGELLTPDIVPL